MNLFCRIVFLLLVLPGLGIAQIRVKASYGTPSLSQVVFPLGMQAGMFGRHGLSMEAVYIAGRSINVLLSGDVQFGLPAGRKRFTRGFPERV